MVRITPNDLSPLTKEIDIAVRNALVTFMDSTKHVKAVTKVHSNSVNHTTLEPEGNLFTIHITVEVHEKTTP